MRRRVFVLVAALAVGLSGCATVPDSGPPVAEANRKLEGADLTVYAPLVEPPATGGPVDTVTLLFDAARNTQSRQLLGEAFFTTSAREAWKPTDVWIVRSPRATVSTATATSAGVKLVGTVVGKVNEQGVYQSVQPFQQLDMNLNLVHRDIWRLDTAPPGVLMQESDFEQAFQQLTLYFPAVDTGSSQAGGSGEALVPDPRFVSHTNAQGAATSVVGLILDGPSPWLRPIARRPLPPKTTTHGNVTTQDNDLVIDFTPEIEGATNTDVNLFAAQVAWSLPTRLDGSLRLQVNGRDLNVDGAPAVQDAGNWTRYNPHGHKPTSLYYLTKGGLKRFVDQAGNNQAQPPPEAFGGVIARTGVVSAAVSLDETALALVKGPAGSQTLYLGDITGKAKAVATGAAIGRPSWGGSQDAVLVPIDGTIHQVEVTGNVVRLPLPGLAAPVRAVRASLDGTRIALVAGDGANARAYVGLIDRTQDAAAPVISNLRLLRSRQGKTPDTPLIARIQDIGWSGPTTLSVAGQEADGTSAVRSVTIDAALEPGPVRTGLRPGPVTLAVSPLTSTPQTEYAEVAGQLYQGGQRSWSPLTSLTDVQRPFYPG